MAACSTACSGAGAPCRGIYLWGGGRARQELPHGRVLPPACRSQPSGACTSTASCRTSITSSRELQGQAEPLRIIAERMAEDTRLLCLDEFHVTDIGDAMLMRGLLDGAVRARRGPGDDIQPASRRALRARPAARAVPARDRADQGAHSRSSSSTASRTTGCARWSAPACITGRSTPLRDSHLQQAFEGGGRGARRGRCALEIEGRTIRALRLAPGVAWFDVRGAVRRAARHGRLHRARAALPYGAALAACRGSRPGMAESMRRFTWLVDEFYDRRVKLIMSAEVPLLRSCTPAVRAPVGSRAHPQPADRDADRAVPEQAAPGMNGRGGLGAQAQNARGDQP